MKLFGVIPSSYATNEQESGCSHADANKVHESIRISRAFDHVGEGLNRYFPDGIQCIHKRNMLGAFAHISQISRVGAS